VMFVVDHSNSTPTCYWTAWNVSPTVNYRFDVRFCDVRVYRETMHAGDVSTHAVKKRQQPHHLGWVPRSVCYVQAEQLLATNPYSTACTVRPRPTKWLCTCCRAAASAVVTDSTGSDDSSAVVLVAVVVVVAVVSTGMEQQQQHWRHPSWAYVRRRDHASKTFSFDGAAVIETTNSNLSDDVSRVSHFHLLHLFHFHLSHLVATAVISYVWIAQASHVV